MTLRPSLQSFFAASRRRTIDEAAMADILLLGGWVTAPGAATAEARVAAAALAADLRPPGPDSCFDPAEAVCRLIGAGRDDPASVWRNFYVTAGRRRAVALCGQEDHSLSATRLRDLTPRRFNAVIRRTFGAFPLRAGTRLRLPMPIEDAALRDLSVAIDPMPAMLGGAKQQAGRIETRLCEDHDGPLTIAVRYSFTAFGGRPSSDPSDGPEDMYLKSAEGPIQVTSAIRQLADRLAPHTHGLDAVGAFFNYILDELSCGPVPHDRLGPAAHVDWVIANRWFDCHLGTALLVSLCRAKAMHARMVGGYLLYPAAPMEHYWAEVWIDGEGWMPFDTFASDLSAAGADPGWRGLFFGATDYRMKTQRFPGHFTGAVGIAFPAEWHRFTRPTPEGVATDTIEIPTGRLVMRDEISVSTL